MYSVEVRSLFKKPKNGNKVSNTDLIYAVSHALYYNWVSYAATNVRYGPIMVGLGALRPAETVPGSLA